MLNCVYHPIDDMRVVDDMERERLVASGFWFDSPKDAKAFRSKVEKDVKDESKPKKAKAKSDKVENVEELKP